MKGSLVSRPLACLDVVQRRGCRHDLMHDMGDGSWRSTNALASIDAEVEMLSGSYREVRQGGQLSAGYFMARSEMIRKPRTWPVFRVERTSPVDQQKTGKDPFRTFPPFQVSRCNCGLRDVWAPGPARGLCLGLRCGIG